MTVNIEDRPQVIYMLAGDLESIVESAVNKAISALKPQKEVTSPIVYGIEGIAAVLGCSKSTAMRIKNSGALDGRISQVGKTIAAYEHHILEGGAKYHQAQKVKAEKHRQPRKITLR